MNLRVVLRQRGGEGRTLHTGQFSLGPDEPLTFGRAAAHNRLHVPDDKKMVSSRHGRIELRGVDCYVVDLGSVNGTRLDGRPVAPEAPLGSGGTITVGDFELVVAVVSAASAAAPAPALAGDQTLHGFDPDRTASEVWAELCRQYAAQRRVGAAQRHAGLIARLRDSVASLPPAQRRAVLKRVLAEAGDAGATAAPVRGADPAAGTDEELLQAGLNGLRQVARSLNADRQLTEPRDVARLVERLQSFHEAMLTWLVQCLKGRAEFENEFGAEVTMVFQRSNNPLKGLAPKDLAARLFDWSDDQQKAQQAQLEGILRDLTQHQLGLLGGVTEAIRSVTERLAPAAIETLAQKDAGLLTSKGAKAWEIYQKIYRELLEEKSKLFHEVISPAIRKGYLMVHDQPPTSNPSPRSP